MGDKIVNGLENHSQKPKTQIDFFHLPFKHREWPTFTIYIPLNKL